MTYVQTTRSDREFTDLPIDNVGAYPQSFSILFNNLTYHFRLYVCVSGDLSPEPTAMLHLPGSGEAYMVVRVEIEQADGVRRSIFLRKIIPGLEYETGDIVLRFDTCRVAVQNLNGFGDFGSRVSGGMAARWA